MPIKKLSLVAIYSLLCACSSTPVAHNAQTSAAEINTKLALAYLSQQDVARSKEKLLLAQQQAPLDPTVWYSRGYFLERTGDFSAAEQSYLHAIQLAPNLGASHNNYGAFLCRRGNYQRAIAQFLAAINDPNYLGAAAAYSNAALCALKIPDPALAHHYAQLAAARAGSI